MIRQTGVWVCILLSVCVATGSYAQDEYLPGDKAEVILGPTEETGIQIVKAGTSIILKGECRDAVTKFTIWRLQQQFGNITDLTYMSGDTQREFEDIEKSFSRDLSLSFDPETTNQLAADLRFNIIEGHLVVSGYANNNEDIAKIENIAKIYDTQPVINVEMRKDMIELDAIFCRIQRTDGNHFGTEGLQSAKIVVPGVGYTFQGAEHSNAGDALNNDGGSYTSIDHRASAEVNATEGLVNTLTSHFRVQEKDVKILIRPHLSTLNGQQAVFHSGGQQPFEIATQNVQNIEWKDYGTKLTIVPTLTTEGLIEVDVNIELIVPLDDAENRFTKFSHNGRAILKENEALVLSGLVQQLYQMNVERTPFLSKIPLLSFFFGSEVKDHAQEEMAVVVMPRRPAVAKSEVRDLMKGTDDTQNMIIETAPSMGPVPDNPDNSRPAGE